LESWLRAGGGGDAAGFIARHLVPVLYPATLTRDMQVILGALALLVNVCVYRRGIARQGGAISGRWWAGACARRRGASTRSAITDRSTAAPAPASGASRH